MTKSTFKQVYSQLNQNQKKAVNAIEGPVMVVAGPGTGKTQILATRIANILLKTDTDPSAILALTFTDSAAQNMRQRLLALIGLDAYKVHVSTFHSFCSSVIKEYPEYFIFSNTQQQLTDLERLQVVHQIISATRLNTLKPINAPHYYSQAITSSIQTLKREGITPNKLNHILKQELKILEQEKDNLSQTEFNHQNKNLQKNLELLSIYKKYQKQLLSLGRFDFEDMINWVIQAFNEHSDLLAEFQERFHYFLIDEFQDTNTAQTTLVDLLASFWGEQANIFVVGDPNQSIFRFQGASLENTFHFQKKYPPSKTITLTDSYRSQQTILNASSQVIKQNNSKTTLTSQVAHPKKPITIINTNHELTEKLYLVKAIKKLLSKKTNPSEIAILARNNADLYSLAHVLNLYHLPHQVLGGHDVLTTPINKYFLKLLQVILKSRHRQDDLDLFTLMHYPFTQLNPLDILKLTRAAAKNKSTLINTLHSKEFTSKKIISKPKPFLDFLDLITQLNQSESQLTFTEFSQATIQDSGLLSWLLQQPDSSEHLTHLNALFEFIKQLNRSNPQLNLVTFLDHLQVMQENNLKINPPEINLNQDKIILTTVHKAKGMEWEHVFITQCFDGKWGNQRTRNLITLPSHILSSPELAHHSLQEERRLFYVALTRAKKQVTITYANTYHSYGRDRQVTPSQFIGEIPQKFKKLTTPTITKKETNHLLQKLITPANISVSNTEKDFLNDILQDFKLSVTALNTYLSCPYKFKLNTLLRVPKAKEPYLSFGTAVHSALEKFYNQFAQTKKLPSKNYFISEFKKALKREVMTKENFKARLSQGKKILGTYYDFYKSEFTPTLFTEKFLGYGFSSVYLDDIPLAGKLDRIDLLSPQEKTIKVIDYKTGKRKTRGQIEGSTQDSDGSYKRQLVFYKLLSDLDKKFTYTITQTELDFVERPSTDNKSGKEVFIVTPEEIKDLKKIIRSTMKNIRALKFPRTTDYSICQRCEFADHCWPKGIPTTTSQNTPQKEPPFLQTFS